MPLNDFRPLPAAVRIGHAEVQLQPIPCPKCETTLRARDVEETELGYRLACDCGFDLFAINDAVILNAIRGHR